MDQRLDAIAGMGKLISRRGREPLDWTDPNLLGWSDLVATAVWPALDDETRTRHADRLEGFAVAHALNTERNADILLQLERVAARLNAAGFEPIILKGAGHLATDLWPTPGSRLVADIDLLVGADDLDQVFSVLEDMAGAGAQDRGHPELVARKKHMPPIHDAGGPAPVEIHHCVFSGASERLMPYPEIHARSVQIIIGSARARIASPTDRVLNAMLHGPAGSGTYLAPALHMRDLLDIHFLAELHGSEIDWAWIERQATSLGWAPALEITNLCLERFTGMPPPFQKGGRRSRLDAARWMWQLAHPKTRRAGLAANLLGYAVRSLASGGEPRRWALAYLRQPETYRRAYRRYVLGRSE